MNKKELAAYNKARREALLPAPAPRGLAGAKAGAIAAAKTLFWVFIAPPVALIIVGVVVLALGG